LSEYFIRLATLLGTDFPEKIPLLGSLAKRIGVRHWRETWNDDATVTSAEAVLAEELAWEVGGFRFAIGNASGGETAFRLEIASDRNSLLTTIADRGEEMAGVTDPPPRDGLQIFARADGPPSASRIQLHDLDLRVRLPESWATKGKVEGDRIVPLPGNQPVDIVFLRGTLIVEPDAAKPIQFALDDDEAVTVDPIWIERLGIGIEIDKLKLDLSDTAGIPEVLARPGYQESWTGLYLEKFRIYGMQSLFPTLPDKVDPHEPAAGLIIEVSKVVIGFDDGGVTGSLKVQAGVGPDDDAVLRGAGFELEMERGNLIRFEHQVTLRLGKTGGPDFSQQVNRDLQIVASLRSSPDGRFGWELALKTPGTADEGLLTLGPNMALAIQGALAFWVLMDDINDANYTDALLLSGLLYVLGVLQVNDMLVFKRITLDALRVRYREELVAGRTLKYIDAILDIQLQIALDLPLRELLPWAANFLPNIRTDPDHPLGVLMKGMRISYAWNFDDFTPAELGDRRKLSFGWPQDYFFDLSGQTLLQGSPVMLTKFGFGRWDRGVWMDLGLKLAVNEPAAAYSLMPSVVRLYFLSSGDFDHATFEGLSLSILVPGVLFIRGRLNLGDTMTEAALQGWFVSSPGLSIKDYEKRENWYWDVGAQYRKTSLPDGTESSIVFAWLKTSCGIPIFFLPGTALYGGHFLYAKNARPALGGDTIEKWYTDHEPKNQIEIDKWEGNPDSTGIGFGLVLGAQADRGRPWNLQLGLLYADSQWLLSGYLNLFKQRPDPADTSSGSLRMLGAWGAGRLLGSVRWVEQVPADGKVMKLDLGAELLVDDDHDASHFYAGFHWPPERHLKAILFERYEAGFYLMQDAADVENFAGLGLTLPGFASALGARFSIEGGRKKGHLKLYFYFHAAADLAFAGSDPFITVVHASVAGGLVAKAYGIGFELEAAADFLWVRPQPSLLQGKIKITLDLPWPIPNLHYTLDVTDGSDGPTEDLVRLVEGLTLIPRLPSGVVELDGSPGQAPVPLDTTFVLAFSYPTRNSGAVDGNFQITAAGLNAVDTSVMHETSDDDNGYAVELTALRLWRGTPGVGTLHPGPVPAKWVKQDTPAAGGEPSRRVLELFSVEDIALSRLIGPSAELVSDLTDGWSPCEPATPPGAICYLWTDEPLGPIGEHEVVELAQAPPLQVGVAAEPEGAESTRRYFGWTAQLAAVVPFSLLSGIVRALQLSGVEGATLPDTPAAPLLELRFATAHVVLLEVVRPGRGRRVTVRFYLGDRLVKEDSEGVRAPGLEGRWEHVFYICDGPVDRAVIETVLQGDPEQEDAAAYLVRVCEVLESEYRHYQDAVDSAQAWGDFWTVLDTADPLVLQPASHYTLEIEGNWSRVKEGTETPGGPFAKTFEFDTVGQDQWPQQLRGIEQSVDGKANYDIKTVPAAGAVAVYADRAIRLEFRNRRIEAMYAAFGRHLAIRLVDDQGGVDTRWLNYTPEPPSDLPASELAWLDVVRSAPCTPGDVEWHWYFPVVRLTAVLAPGRRYDASLFALEDSTTDFNAVDWKNQPTIHQFTFRTSRWPTFALHLAAYTAAGALDEMVPVPANFAALATAVGPEARVADDALLATAMTDLLGLPRREPPPEPELVRVWQSSSTGDQLVALLMDGPEPLPRPNDGAMEVRTAADTPIPVALVQGASGTRTLILFRDGGSGFRAIDPEPLRLAATEQWIAADGTSQVESAILDLPVPARPAFLEPEGPP
jgi:hypothetical protein